ncbi:5-formyltetrahydrofolate cyclo-ligase [Alteribacillus persepolensis]|uniref:5-formyltetrahydrofolate cyclo-ligase n=1 Tax=Alteribacillus persepolensis TaxID=568899 RepID=A0A1G8CVG8_9BACI|nr:5-formyltetrahydrofolate cyclo-ligase [Alteribacillus persepolensis]SDH49482.1 5-formyltetrahydrofolate cyclo-ligase [Alteribacillus persepolensis]
METKRDFRIHTKQQFEKHSISDIKQKSNQIYENLFLWDCWKKAASVAVTIASQHEIDTKPIIEKGWEQGKTIACPKVIPDKRTMEFYQISSFQQTHSDYAGIMAPDPEVTSRISAEYFDLVIVPGLAFDKEKYRIGFGGGFYDRFLAGTSVTTCGLALDFQVFETIPKEEHDIALTALITEAEIVY